MTAAADAGAFVLCMGLLWLTRPGCPTPRPNWSLLWARAAGQVLIALAASSYVALAVAGDSRPISLGFLRLLIHVGPLAMSAVVALLLLRSERRLRGGY